MGGEEKSIAKRDNTLPVEVKKPERKKFYRYDNWYHVTELGYVKNRIEEEVFYGIRATPCGWWVHWDKHYSEADEKTVFHSSSYGRKRWISNTSRKRFCYPTRREALNSFIIRKSRQIGILENQIEAAKMSYKEAKELYDKNEVPKNKRFPWS